jgi:integrase
MATTKPDRHGDTPTLDLLECLFEYAGGYFRLRNFAPATRRGYLSDQLLFVRYVKGSCGVSRVSEVERAHIVEYLSQAELNGLRGRTRARRLAALRSFFGHLEEAGRIPASPVRGIPRPKQEAKVPRVLTEAEYRRLRAAARRWGIPPSRRHRATWPWRANSWINNSRRTPSEACNVDRPGRRMSAIPCCTALLYCPSPKGGLAKKTAIA